MFGTKRKSLFALLAVALTMTMLIAMPAKIFASTALESTDMVIIDISELGDESKDNSAAFSFESQWQYEAIGDPIFGYRTLILSTPGGNYTLVGNNENLLVLVGETAIGANVTLNNVYIGSQQRFNPNTFRTCVDCTVTLIGENFLHCLTPTISTIFNSSMTIAGDGKLTATSEISSVFFFDNLGVLTITGEAQVTAVANCEVLQVYDGIFIGDNASLTTLNNGSTSYSATFYKADPTDTHQWKLTNAILLSGDLTSDSITVLFEAGKTVTVAREEKVKSRTITVNGVEIEYEVFDGVAIIVINNQAELLEILTGADVVFDLTGYCDVNIRVPAAWFAGVDKTITIKTDNGVCTVKTKTIWNNSGKDRLIQVRNNKVELFNIK